MSTSLSATNETKPKTGLSLSKKELAQSALFPQITTTSRAAVILSIAESFGISPWTAANNVYFVSGKPCFSSNLIASLVKSSGKYDYRVKKKTAKECTIAFLEKVDGKWVPLGEETFTMEMATRAKLTGKDNWKHFPEAMLFARCLTAGQRTYCPDVLGGTPAYTVEELSPNTEVDEDGRPKNALEEITPAEVNVLSPRQKEIARLLVKTDTDRDAFYSHFGISGCSDLTDEQIDEAMAIMEAKLKVMQ